MESNYLAKNELLLESVKKLETVLLVILVDFFAYLQNILFVCLLVF